MHGNGVSCMTELTEAQEQKYLFHWAAAVRQRYPELALLYHVPNGGKRDAAEAANLRMQGVKAGVPDLCLPVARHGYNALYIELKRRIGGKASPAQLEWLNNLRTYGNYTAICHGWEDAAAVIEKYLTKNEVTE